MRVFYYSVFNNYGGIENFAKNIISAVINKRDDVKYTIISSNDNFPFQELFISLGCDIEIVPSLRKPKAFYKKILNIFKTGNKETDIVQINICTYRNPLVHMAAKKSGLRTITVGHYSNVEGKLKILHYINRFKYRNFGLKVSVSNHCKDFTFGKKADSIIIDNGVDSKLFAFNGKIREDFRKKLNISENEILIGQVGRYSPEKNQMFTIELFNQISRRYSNVKLCFVGNGDFAKVKEYIKQNKLDNKVIIGHATYQDITNWYNSFDLFFMPSKHEAFGLTLLEALSNGLTSFVSNNVPTLDVDGPVSYLENEIDKWLDCSINFIKAINQPYPRKNYILNSKYSLDRCASKYIDLYFNYDKYKK